MLLNKTNRFSFVAAGIVMTSLFCSLHLNDGFASAYTASITTSNSISFDVSPSGDGTSIHNESINVQSDCRAGYNLTIATPEGSDLYKYDSGTQAGTASFTAVDGTSALNSSNNTNKWGYTLSSNPTSSTVFSPLSSTQAVLKTPSQTASPSADINDTFSINYGVKVDNTIAPGNYQMASQGAVVYYLTMDTTCTQFTVAFDPNGGTVADGGNNPTQGIEASVPTKLASADSVVAPQGASYTDAGNNTIMGTADKLWTFWGWNTQIDGTGDWYKDREAVEDLTGVGSTITLYAQWKQATLADMVAGAQVGTEKVIDHNEMQDMSPETCYNSTAYSTSTSSDAHNPYDASTNPNGYHTITLLDYRGKVTTGENPESPESYTVSKLPDNLCWMTKDLNLGRESGGANNDGTITLTPEDTNLADNTTFTLPVSPTTYTTGAAGYRTPQILVNHTVTSYTINSISYSPTIGHYSWAAATATDTSISASGEVTTSICPKDWNLPTRTQFYNLRSKGSVTSATIAHAAPYNFVYGGYRNAANGYYNQTSYGYYWTSSNSGSSYGYWNYVYSSGIYNGSVSTGYKYYGAKVRCVASQGRVTIEYDGNGTTEYPVTGTTASQTNVEVRFTNTSANGFTRTGWAFDGWNTAPDGTGTAVSADASLSDLNIKPGSTLTLYAQWLPQYTITYINNCRTYANTNGSCTQTVSNGISEQKINLANNPSTGTETGTLAAYNKWTLTGWKITGWTTNADGSGTEYKISSTYTVPSGSSVGDGITLYARWAQVYSIQYDGSGADNPNGMGTTDQSTGVKSVKQTNVSQGDPVVLLASNFKKAGYGFAGWSTNPNATVTSGDKIYGPMETIDAPAYPNNGTSIITMYAVWVPAKKDGNNNPVYLQDFTTNDCNALTSASFNSTTGAITSGSVIALTDKRDNQIYTVAKLADNNCWMIENLRLEHAGTVGNNVNGSSVTNQNLSQGYGGTTGTYGSFVGLADPESYFYATSAVSNTIYKSSDASPTDTYDPANNVLEDIGSTDLPNRRFPRYNSSNTLNLIDSTTFTQNYANASSPSGNGTFPGANLYSYGNYYTWHAAIANTNYYSSSSISEVSGTSICPSNWHLPSSDSTSKEYGILSQSYGGSGSNQSSVADAGDIMSSRFRTFPNNFLYSGNYSDDSSARYRGSGGYYWSRSASGASNSYLLNLTSQSLYSSNGNFQKNYGSSVRCLINTSMAEIILDLNDGTGSTLRIYGVTDDSVDLPQLRKAGYKLKGWNTLANGSGTNYTTSYAIPSGSSGTTLYAQWIPTYTIQYDGNGADNPNGMGTTDANGVKSVKYINVSQGDTFKLLPSNFKRSGYGFLGWSTDSDAWAHFTDNDNTNDPTIYGPMESISAPPYPNSAILTLYAVWAPAEKNNNNQPIYFQDFDSQMCSSLTSTSFDSATGSITAGSVIALTDKRDNEVYAIARLADGKCWMIENLRLEAAGTRGNNINDNSVTNESLSQGYGKYSGSGTDYGYFAGLADAETSGFSGSNANSLYSTTTDGDKIVINTVNSPSVRMPRYNHMNTYNLIDSTSYTVNYLDSSNVYSSGTSYLSSNIYSYGNYYKWAAAMANTNYTPSVAVAEAANTSICPNKWKLPTAGSTSKDYDVLSQSYGSNGSVTEELTVRQALHRYLRTFPNNFVLSGYYTNNYVNSRGTDGPYWSTSGDGNWAIYLDLQSYLTQVSIGNFHKENATAIRCVIDNGS